jgi:site-specific recombinase XerD
MSEHAPELNHLLEQFRGHLSKKRYASRVINRYVAVAGHFLHFLERQQTSIAAVQPTHVAMYLQSELRRFHRRHGRAPSSIGGWRCSHTPGIHEFLRMLTGQWPTLPGVSTPAEDFIQRLCHEYTQWLDNQRGLAATTIDDLEAEARRFLSWHAGRTTTETLLGMQVADIDAYLQDRSPSLRRITRKTVAQRLRCFLRFAHVTGRTDRDFAPCVMAPTLYAFETIPSALSPDAIRAVLNTTREDRSPRGLRDYAILQLLSTYGLRAGEITQLQLDDIDWRADRFCVRHTKTGAQSFLPLLPRVGEALLAYLRRGRPSTEAREIFIRTRAPYLGLDCGSSLYGSIRRRLEAAGGEPKGKKGPHTFRHARAVSLLRAAVPLKAIGDMLGHRSTGSVMAYLKLDTEELRAVALEIPSAEEL